MFLRSCSPTGFSHFEDTLTPPAEETNGKLGKCGEGLNTVKIRFNSSSYLHKYLKSYYENQSIYKNLNDIAARQLNGADESNPCFQKHINKLRAMIYVTKCTQQTTSNSQLSCE